MLKQMCNISWSGPVFSIDTLKMDESGLCLNLLDTVVKMRQMISITLVLGPHFQNDTENEIPKMIMIMMLTSTNIIMISI